MFLWYLYNKQQMTVIPAKKETIQEKFKNEYKAIEKNQTQS